MHFLKVDQAQIRLLKCYMATSDPNILHMFRFRTGKVTPLPNIYWKRRQSSQARNTFWNAPSWRDGISGPASCLRGPGPSFLVASTAAPLDTRNSAAATWPLYAARKSGVSPQALSPGSRRPPWLRGLGEEADFAETTKIVGSWVPPVQPTVLDSTSSKLFKAKYIHKHNEQVSIHLSCLEQEPIS